jgi:hypothetical protein
MSLSSQRIA